MGWIEFTWDVISSNILAAWDQIRHLGLNPGYINSTVFLPFIGLTGVMTLILTVSAVLRIWGMFHGNN